MFRQAFLRAFFVQAAVITVIFGSIFSLNCVRSKADKPVQEKYSLDELRKKIEADPTDKEGLFHLGTSYKESNFLNKAIETYSVVISLQPDFPDAYFERGYCYGKMGLFPQAKADMDASIRYQPQHGPSYFYRGRAYEALGDIKSACNDYKKAAELGIKDAEVYIHEKCNN